jgi:hypothetical protein
MLKHIHSGIRWIVLGLLVYVIVKALMSWFGNKADQEGDKKMPMMAMMAVHLQVIIGLLLFFVSPRVVMAAESMKDAVKRFFLVEHPLMMIIAAVLLTIGYSRHKKMSGARKHRTVFIYYLLALVIILWAIPWPSQMYGAKWF